MEILLEQEAAFNRALVRAKADKIQVSTVAGAWFASSASRPGLRHLVNGSCDCEAGQRGIMCKHVAAVVKARAFAGELHQCEHCGRLSDDVVLDWVHVGGHTDRQPLWQCYDLTACEARWDAQHGLVAPREVA